MKFEKFFEPIPLLIEVLLLALSNRVIGVQFPCDVVVKDIQQCNESINVVFPQIRPLNAYQLIDYSYGRSCLKSISKYQIDETSTDKMVIYLQFDRSFVLLEVRYSLKVKNPGKMNLNVEAEIGKWSILSKRAEVMTTMRTVRIL